MQINCTADQCLCFRFMDGTIYLLKSEITKFCLAFVAVQAGLCLTWLETPKACFHMTLLFIGFGPFNTKELGHILLLNNIQIFSSPEPKAHR